MKDLKVLFDNNGSFVDFTDDMTTYLRDSQVIDLVNAEDYLYFGLYKPFSMVYAELSVINEIPADFTIEYYNGSSWVSAVNGVDYTKGFTRSGFISWDLDQTGWSEVTVDTETAYWIRVKTNTALSATTALQGLNLVYANDLDMQEGYYTVNDLLPEYALSFISFHQAARNEIIQQLRNNGDYTINGDLTKWDLLKPDQVREAAKWKALELLFFSCSNEVDDKYDILSKDARTKYTTAMNLYLKSIDKNDDGVLSPDEEFNITTTMVYRI